MFGDGHDYDWALADDEEIAMDDDAQKQETKYQDVSVTAVPSSHAATKFTCI